MNGWCTNPGGWRARSYQKDLTFDGFKGAVPLFTYYKDGGAKSDDLDGIFGGFGARRLLRGPPWVTDGWCTTTRRQRGRTNLKDLTFDGCKGLFPSLPMKKTSEPDLVISVAFLVALGFWRGPMGWQKGYASPHKADGVGWIRETNQKAKLKKKTFY